MDKIYFEQFQKLSPILANNLNFPEVVVFIFKVFGCGLHLGTLSQNQGSRCPLTYFNEHFNITTMKIGSGLEAGQYKSYFVIDFLKNWKMSKNIYVYNIQYNVRIW